VGAASFFGTVGLGYDFQMAPKWLFGVLADYDFASSQDASVSGGGAVFLGPDDGGAGVTLSTEMGDTWSVGARLGYLINQRTLVYAMGGYSEAEFSLSGSVEGNLGPIDFGPYSVSSGKSWRQGYFVGGGLETMLAENLSAKLEYRYAQYDGGSFDVEDTFSINGTDGDVIGGASMSDPDVHSIRAALSWRFGNWGR
jgi:outer membrane immunogenic protein